MNLVEEIRQNYSRIVKLEEEIDRCPIKITAIQFYAEMFEQSNQNYNKLVTAIHAMEELIREQHLTLLTLFKKLNIDISKLEEYEPLNRLYDLTNLPKIEDDDIS